MSSGDDRRRGPGEPPPLPAPSRGRRGPKADPDPAPLLDSQAETVRPLPDTFEADSAVGDLAAGASLLEKVSLPGHPGASSASAVTRVSGRPPADSDDGFEETEETTEWSLDKAKAALAGVGEDSHVIGGRYRILEGLAMGGMGAVFKVRHLKLGKAFALKIIHSSLSEDANMQRFFFREARILSQLDHPNIVDVTDFGSDDRFGAYLVMEYLKGESVHDRLEREERIDARQALAVGLQVAEALRSMHADELVHCDIKPENIFLCRPGKGPETHILAKLIDFGLSRNMALGAELDSSEVGGTPIYAAPEQLNGLAPQASMDIYAVGELLYHMLTGQPPFVGSIPEICAAKLSKPPDKPSGLIPEPLDPRLEGLIMKALATRPEDRQNDMAQLVAELRAAGGGLGLESGRVPRKKGAEPASPALAPSAALAGGARLWADCTLPVFVVDPGAKVIRSTPGFERLAASADATALGQPLGSTKLGNIYPQIDADVINAVAQRTPLQRLIRFRSARDEDVALTLWLVPRLGEGGEVLHLWGVVVPS